MNVDHNALALSIHSQNVEAGWWDDFLPDNKGARFECAMMLVISEVAEAMEGFRRGLKDDHLPDEEMFDVELADAAIRLYDLAGAYGFDLKPPKFLANPFMGLRLEDVPDKLYRLCGKLTHGSRRDVIYNGLQIVWLLAIEYNVDLPRLIAAKREYNRNRADHKRENRAKAGGKKL